MEKPQTKIAGIACDDYKLTYFKEQISKKGYKILDSNLLMNKTYLIRIEYEEGKMQQLASFIKALNTNFRRN